MLPPCSLRGEASILHGSTLLTASAVARVRCNGRPRPGLLPKRGSAGGSGVVTSAGKPQGTHSRLCPSLGASRRFFSVIASFTLTTISPPSGKVKGKPASDSGFSPPIFPLLPPEAADERPSLPSSRPVGPGPSAPAPAEQARVRPDPSGTGIFLPVTPRILVKLDKAQLSILAV